jgi:dTDP-4-amino-4,6-dideoxygalactose transaminase
MDSNESIPFNKPYYSGKELDYIRQAFASGKISGDGIFTRKCQQFFCEQLGFDKALLTTSCTDALEIAALLANIGPDDEVIVPSFTFPSTANAFALRGAKILFADSGATHPNLDISSLESLISKKTKAIVPVHYAGIACEMEPLLELARAYNLYVIEDAAHSFDSYYKDTPLGSIGHFGTFSFHETKNISSGEGGMLIINASQFYQRAEILREKGTNRSSFFRGEVDKYSWVDIGSSFLPSDIIAAVLYAQLEEFPSIQKKRLTLWNRYFDNLKSLADLGYLELPFIPSYATNNAHMFYILCSSCEERQALIDHLRSHKIYAIFHYVPLHSAPYYHDKHDKRALPNCDRFSQCLLRLPLYNELLFEQVDRVSEQIHVFFTSQKTPHFAQLLCKHLYKKNPVKQLYTQ